MEKLSIVKIAAPLPPPQSGGGHLPEVQGTESPGGGLGGRRPPIREAGVGYEAERNIRDWDPASGGPGELYSPGSGRISLAEEAFLERNRILEEEWGMSVIREPADYFRVLFSREGVNGTENYMQATGEQHWGDHHYNAVAYALYPCEFVDKSTGVVKIKEGAMKYDITRDCVECDELMKAHQSRGGRVWPISKVISSPILYAGHSRKQVRARSIWGIGIDLDDVQPVHLHTLRKWIDKLDMMPEPSMIVSSGGGLHLYFLFPHGVGTKSSTVKSLQRLKHNMTKYIWNECLSASPEADLHQGIWQGFRIPGTPTKMSGVDVVGFVPAEINYYTVAELNRWFRPETASQIGRDNKPLSDAEVLAVDNDKYLPSALSFAEAREKWPDWDPTKPAGQWVANRKLYDWWLHKVILGGLASRKDVKGTIPLAQGRRFYWMQSLVSFAKKCAIEYEELRRDAYSLLELFDSLTVEDDNHFTILDIEAALKMYHLTGKESVARWTKKYIGAKTHFLFKEAKRNGRKRAEHVEIMNAIRGVMSKNGTLRHGGGAERQRIKVGMWSADHPYFCSHKACADALGLDPHTVAKWWPAKSPKTIPESILLWRHDHPGIANKSLCARECGITRPTVIKWWNCTAEDAKAEFERLNAISAKGLAVANGAKKNIEIGDNAVGAAASKEYITDQKIAAIAMRHAEGYEEESSETIKTTGEELADAINFGHLQFEKMMAAMGVDEDLIPLLKAGFEQIIQTPEFLEKVKKLRPLGQFWPPEVRKLYDAAVDEHHKNQKK